MTDYLTAAEADDVRSRGPRTEQDAAANLYWSAKEAALKVRRTGLRADTRTVVVTFDRAVDEAGWGRLAVRHTPSGGLFPGWWRRDGVFLLTMAVGGSLPAPAAVLPGSADLARAVPLHSWVNSPTAW